MAVPCYKFVMAARTDAIGAPPPNDAIAALERLNEEASRHHIWLRTRPNAPQHRPWHEGAVEPIPGAAPGRPGAAPAAVRAVPHLWRWRAIEPYLHRIAEIAPLGMTERQQFLLVNPGLGGRLQVGNTIRVAISIYKPGDVAETHLHTPNASRTILSREGGYTAIDGERCTAQRGDLVLTPAGTWHGHGNDSAEPVIWMDVLDWPVIEQLDCVWSRSDAPADLTAAAEGVSDHIFSASGIVPRFAVRPRPTPAGASSIYHYSGAAIRRALDALALAAGDPYDGIIVEFTDPMTGGPAFPTLAYTAQLLRPGAALLPCRHSATTLYCVLAGRGRTEVNGQALEWEENDIFVVPPAFWRRHVNTDPARQAILYAVTDAPLLRAIRQYRAQGRDASGAVVELDR